MGGFVFFRLCYFYYSDLQLFAIFIIEVDLSETCLMTSAEKSVLEPLNLTIFRGRIPPEPPYKARTFGTRDNAPTPPVTKNLATALVFSLADCTLEKQLSTQEIGSRSSFSGL